MNVEQDLVRAYFEANGFWVKCCKGTLENSKKPVLSLFEIFNSSNQENKQDISFRLFSGDLTRIRSAYVCLLGWEDSFFSNELLTSDAKLVKFLRKEVDPQRIELSRSQMPNPAKEMLLILVVPALPKSESRSLEIYDSLRKSGVRGVLTLSSILENLLRKSSGNIDTNGSPVYHLLKILRAYGLATEPQLDIFT